LRIAALYTVIAVLHLVGWGSYLHYAGAYPAIVGMGFVAYMLGLRHAFDADHIAAIDDTVRLMLQKGRQPVGLGFFFSLGHSTVVLALTVAGAIAATAIKQEIPQLKQFGETISALVSGGFLWVVGVVNLYVLLDILKIWKKSKSGTHDHAHLDELLRRRGLVNRMTGGRLTASLNHSWQMYPLGLLFGLGFDTASEISLLAMTAGASAGNLPFPALLSLPILFTAGMTAMDTTDGILMVKVYNWAFVNPARKIFYNITTTGLSVAVALAVGSVQLAQVAARALEVHGWLPHALARFDLGILGYLIVGLFLTAWGVSAVYWKLANRWYGRPESSSIRVFGRYTRVAPSSPASQMDIRNRSGPGKCSR
jgi:high-affinity nickel-transport protein